MPANFSRTLTGAHRTDKGNKLLGLVLAFIAGASNAGGFLAVHQYTSHMTGILSSMADNLALGAYALCLAGLSAIVCFVLGAACTAFMVNYARRHHLSSEYALSLLLEAFLLLVFGVMGAFFTEAQGVFVPFTVMLLAFIMGLQNALITKISNAQIRTTHVTGIMTDIGIELGKLVYWNMDAQPDKHRVVADRQKLWLLFGLASLFFLGGVAGAFGFKQYGYIATVPLAIVLIAFASAPAFDDLLRIFRQKFTS